MSVHIVVDKGRQPGGVFGGRYFAYPKPVSLDSALRMAKAVIDGQPDSRVDLIGERTGERVGWCVR